MRLERDRYAAKASTGTAWYFAVFPRCCYKFHDLPRPNPCKSSCHRLETANDLPQCEALMSLALLLH